MLRRSWVVPGINALDQKANDAQAYSAGKSSFQSGSKHQHGIAALNFVKPPIDTSAALYRDDDFEQ